MRTSFIASGICVFALVGCTTTRIEQSLSQVCTGLIIADAAFQAARLSFDIPQHIVAKEAIAMAGVAEICADPLAVTDTASAIEAVGRAITAVGDALADARNVAPPAVAATLE